VSQKLSALIIGVGSIGERHLRCFQATGRFEVSACDTNRELGEAVAARYGCAFYPSLDDALAQGKFDAAVVCTFAPTHVPVATRCLEHGLHTLIEKPLSLSEKGISEMEALAAAKRLTVRVGYPGRVIPSLLTLKSLIDEGALGAPRHVTVVAGQHFPTFRPAYQSIYYRSHESGGGVIQDALTHHVHSVEWLLSPIRRVFASADRLVLEGVEVEDTVNMTTVLEGNILASFAYNHFQAPNEVTITIHGTKASARYEFHRLRLGLMARGDSDWSWTEHPLPDRDAIFVRQAAAFRDAIDGRPCPLSTVAEARQTMRVNGAALESVRTRREITIPS
jgi:predicted dehydrogenase